MKCIVLLCALLIGSNLIQCNEDASNSPQTVISFEKKVTVQMDRAFDLRMAMARLEQQKNALKKNGIQANCINTYRANWYLSDAFLYTGKVIWATHYKLSDANMDESDPKNRAFLEKTNRLLEDAHTAICTAEKLLLPEAKAKL